MRRFIIPDRSQLLLMAHVDLNSVAPIGSAVYAIDSLIDSLDTSQLEDEYDIDSEKGKNPIHPKTKLKVALYAIHSCRFSLRKMEKDMKSSLPYMWLTGSNPMDHSTMGKFLVRHLDYIEDLFTQVVIIATEKELVDFDVLSIDSVKIRANASYKQDRSLSSIEREDKKLKEKIHDLLKCVENEFNRDKEIEIIELRIQKLDIAKDELNKRIEEKVKGKGDKEKEKIIKKEKINLTDHDANKMQQANGEINPAYSVTTATNSKSDIITHFQVNKEDNDEQALVPAILGSKEKCGQDHTYANADSGFFSFLNLRKLLALGQRALIPDKRYEVDLLGLQKKGNFDKYHFLYNSKFEEYTCPAQQKLFKVYEFEKNGEKNIRFANKEACGNCQFNDKCCKGTYRTITRNVDEGLRDIMRENLKNPALKNIYDKRAHAAESPFGNIKHNQKFRIFMRRGLNKVKMECSLLFMLHNILKISKYEFQGSG